MGEPIGKREIFRKYPDVVDVPQLCEMLGGISYAECRENQGVSHWAQLPHPQGKRNSLFAERNTRRLQHCQCDDRQCGVKGIYPLSYRCHLYR